MLRQEKMNVQIQREVVLLSIFEAILLIPFSLRQPLPYYVTPLLLCISFIIVSVPVIRLAGINKATASAVIICLSIFCVYQVHSALLTLSNNRQVVFNNIVASELYSLGVRDSAEVLNLAAPFYLYWPYGDKSPLLYYTAKEPGWLSLTNTFGQKRPFIYTITKATVSRFRIVLMRPILSVEKDEVLSEFELVKQIGGVQVYEAAR
jgi:hypothetical protein